VFTGFPLSVIFAIFFSKLIKLLTKVKHFQTIKCSPPFSGGKATPPNPLPCLVVHVLIPPSPFSAVAKKGVTIELRYKTLPLFAEQRGG